MKPRKPTNSTHPQLQGRSRSERSRNQERMEWLVSLVPEETVQGVVREFLAHDREAFSREALAEAGQVVAGALEEARREGLVPPGESLTELELAVRAALDPDAPDDDAFIAREARAARVALVRNFLYGLVRMMELDPKQRKVHIELPGGQVRRPATVTAAAWTGLLAERRQALRTLLTDLSVDESGAARIQASLVGALERRVREQEPLPLPEGLWLRRDEAALRVEGA